MKMLNKEKQEKLNKKGQSIFNDNWKSPIIPINDFKKIIIKEVPIAFFIDSPPNKTNIGIIKKPPPAPTNPVTNPIELYNNVTYTLGRDLQVVKPMYVKDPATCSSLLSPPDLGLLGKYQPLCLDLRNGEPTLRGGGRYIGEYPIRAIQSRTPVADTDCTWFNANNFQICQAENGAIDCDYFIGATRIMNVKTMPGGAMNVVVSNM